VPENCSELFVTVNIFTEGYTFTNVKDAYVRLAVARDLNGFEPGHVLAKYALDANIKTRGLVFCRIYR
jgi:hypothetical protein